MIKINQLKYFISSVEAGSLTTAAKNLYISQPALSKQLLQLESELGCQLFNRKTTGMELTEAGQYFYQQSSELVNRFDQLSYNMRNFTQKDTIKIGTLPCIGSYLMPTLLSKINPDLKIELTIKDTNSALEDLLTNDRIDFAIIQDAGNYKSILVENLFIEPYDAIINSSSSSVDLDEIKLEELVKDPMILFKQPCLIRDFFDRYCKKIGLDYQVSMEIEIYGSILPFVSNGLGSTILPRMVSSKIKDHNLFVKPIRDGNFGRSIDFLYKSTSKKIAKDIIRLVKEMSQNE